MFEFSTKINTNPNSGEAIIAFDMHLEKKKGESPVWPETFSDPQKYRDLPDIHQRLHTKQARDYL